MIGDVHGCYQPLLNLLAILPPNDHLVFCGDVINRGEAIPATMDLVWDLIQTGRATWLRGNHEQDLIHALENHVVASSQDGLRQHATVGQLGESSARQWLPRLQQLPLIYRGDGWCATHAGFNADGDLCRWRSIRAKRYPDAPSPSPLHEREKPAAMAAMTVSAVSMRAVVAPKRVAARKAAASRAQVRHAPARDGSLEIVLFSSLCWLLSLLR